MDAVLIATAKMNETTARLEGERTLALRKCRQGPTGWCQSFGLDAVELALDEDGDPVTFCIVRPLAGEPVRAVPPTRTPKHAEAIVHAVDDALEAAGTTRCV
jgi:hypothetical protein